MDKSTQQQLKRGEKLVEILKQPQYQPLSVAQQVSVLYAVNTGLLDEVDNSKIQEFKKEWFSYLTSALPDLERRLNEGTAPSDEDKKLLTDNINKITEQMMAVK